MDINKIYRGHTLGITLGITVLSILLLISSASALSIKAVEIKKVTSDSLYNHWPDWSPDGTKIVYAGGTTSYFGNTDLYTINIDGTGKSLLVGDPYEDTRPSWSHDGTKIAYDKSFAGSLSGIWTIDLSTNTKTQILSEANDNSPDWSPDGNEIIFAKGYGSDMDIAVMNADGSNVRILANDPAQEWLPRWNPDGTKIVYQSIQTGNWEIWIMNYDGTNKKQLTNDPSEDGQPDWSPDGKTIAYIHEGNTWLMNVDGSNQIQLTTNRGSDPKWSPDGTKIAFTGYDSTGKTDIWVMTLETDETAPTVECATVDGLWHASDVSIYCTASDSESGLANPTDASFTLSTNVAAGEENSSASTDSHEVCDNAGNCATAGPITGNKVDKKAPSISIITPTGTYTLNQVAAADYSCADGGSGIAACDGPVSSGSNFDTSAVGTKSFTVNANDNVGNTASATNSYNIIYNWNGFFSPIDNLDSNNNLILNSVKAGSGVPAKFSLNGDQGLGIIAIGFPKSSLISCDSNARVDPVNETVAAGSSGLSYDAIADQYIYVWKTEKAWSNTCRQLNVKLVDGTAHVANFKFT